MCTSGHPYVPAQFGSIAATLPYPPRATDKKPLISTRPSDGAAPVVVSLSTTASSTKALAAAPSPGKDYQAAFGTLSSQYGFSGAAPQPVSSLPSASAPSSNSEKSKKKAWWKPSS